MDKIKGKFPVMYDKAVKIAQILTRKMDKLTPESRSFVMEVGRGCTIINMVNHWYSENAWFKAVLVPSHVKFCRCCTNHRSLHPSLLVRVN